MGFDIVYENLLCWYNKPITSLDTTPELDLQQGIRVKQTKHGIYNNY